MNNCWWGLFMCVCVCVCIALWTIVAHNSAQNRPYNFQTVIIAPMMSIWGKGGGIYFSVVIVSG